MRGEITMRIFLSLITLILVTFTPLSQAVAKNLKIVAGTTILADILNGLARPGTEIRTIIPGGACPGHYDVRPGDLKLLSEADALFIHPWQKMQGNMQDFIKTAENQHLSILVVATKGNAMVPPVQSQAVELITGQLSQLDPDNGSTYADAAKKRISTIMAVGKELKQKLSEAGAGRTNVICAGMQKGFVTWAGFNVIADYGRPEDLNPGTVARLISKARDAHVSMVVDNLQSGPDAGKGMAQDLNLNQVTLSNFPGGIKGANTWEETIKTNVKRLLEAMPENNGGS
jgi:zinc transport system substrate-binding protein